MTLSTEQQILIEQRINNDAKSPGIAYALWFFLGLLGAHRFYLGKTTSGILMLCLTIASYITMIIFIGFFGLLAVLIWWVVDAFTINKVIQQEKEAMRARLTQESTPAPAAAEAVA
jgi:TM2 domain-containing membrane protein YozV